MVIRRAGRTAGGNTAGIAVITIPPKLQHDRGEAVPAGMDATHKQVSNGQLRMSRLCCGKDWAAAVVLKYNSCALVTAAGRGRRAAAAV
jgi:hypothetical protein